MMEQLLQYATNRIIELESLLLLDIQETVWPTEVKMVFSQVDTAGDLPAHQQGPLLHHFNRISFDKSPERHTFLCGIAPGPDAFAA
ncbi:hypothetical protein, partial [Salmonella enterica]|uniref:hypothetical protein n=1 Tax=Salmonella enterica TaxID=28901 RepID=UPI00398C2820